MARWNACECRFGMPGMTGPLAIGDCWGLRVRLYVRELAGCVPREQYVPAPAGGEQSIVGEERLGHCVFLEGAGLAEASWAWGCGGGRYALCRPTMPVASRLPCAARETGASRKLASLKQRVSLIPVSLRCSAASTSVPAHTARRPGQVGVASRGPGTTVADCPPLTPPPKPGMRYGWAIPCAPLRNGAFRGSGPAAV